MSGWAGRRELYSERNRELERSQQRKESRYIMKLHNSWAFMAKLSLSIFYYVAKETESVKHLGVTSSSIHSADSGPVSTGSCGFCWAAGR